MRTDTSWRSAGRRHAGGVLALAVALLMLPGPAQGLEPYRTVVTTSRAETPWAEAPRHVLLRDEDDIAAEMPIDGAEAVEQTGAVHLQRTNRAAGTPIIRGLVGPQNLIVIDGLRFNLATFRTGPNQYMALLDPNAASAFEVVPGPGSVLYGGAAMGGVLSMRLRPLRARDGVGGRVRVGFDTVDQAREAALDISARDGRLAGWAGLSLRQHDELTVGGGETLTGTDYQMLDGRARVGVDLDGGWRLTASWLGNATPDATRLDQLPRGDARRYDNRLQTGWVDIERESRGALRHLRLSARLTQLDERVDRWRCDTAGDGLVLDSEDCARRDPGQINRYRDYQDRTRSLGGLAQGTFALLDDHLSLTAGAEVWHDRVSSSMREATRSNDFAWVDKRGNYSDGGSYTEAGLYAQAGYALLRPSATEKLEVIAGGRLNHVVAAADDVPGLGAVDYAFTGLSSTAGLVWTMNKALAAWLRYDSGFRAPNLQETTVLGDTGSTFEVPNAGLDPEQSHTVELGMRAANKLLRGSVAGWWTQIDGIIVSDVVGADSCIEQGTVDGDSCEVDGKPVRRLTNGDQATFMGVTLAGETRPLIAGLGLYGRMMWIDGEIEQVGGGTANPRRLPPLQGRAGLSWRDPGESLVVGVHTTFAARQDKLNSSDRSDLRVCADPSQPNRVLEDCDGTPGWATLGLQARWRLTDKVSVFGRGENLLDARYRVHGSGFDAPGLSIRLGAQADL